jgi:hypothetical protein
MRAVALCLGLGLALSLAQPAAAEDIVAEVKTACQADLDKYCSQVTLGDGRGLACLWAHGDKISSMCEYALYDAAARLEQAINALAFVAGECEEDIKKNCASVAAGEGRIIACVKKAGPSDKCQAAMDKVGVK